MQMTTFTLAISLLFVSSAIASALSVDSPTPEARKALKDWQVFSVSSYTPSGRPGSYPWAGITANVTDPNALNLGNASSDGSVAVVPAGSRGIVSLAFSFTPYSHK